MTLLSGLDSVAWDSLNHAYGKASDIPALLRGLVDPDHVPSELQKLARDHKKTVPDLIEFELWGNLFHQGSVWQASAKAIPFLVEILCDGPPRPALRRFLISYLHHLAYGFPTDTFPHRIDPARSFASVDGMRDEGRLAELADFKARKGATAEEQEWIERLPILWRRDCYWAVDRALPAILPFVKDADQATALEAMALAASFVSAAELAAPTLREVAGGADPLRAGVATVALARLLQAEARPEAERAQRARDPLLAVFGACALQFADQSAIDARSVELLTTFDQSLAKTPAGMTDTLELMVAQCLIRLPPEHRERTVDFLAQRHVEADSLTRCALTGSLMTVAFNGNRAPASADELTPLQRRAVETIRDHGGWRWGTGTFGNYVTLVRDWGLPDSPEKLAAWLGG